MQLRRLVVLSCLLSATAFAGEDDWARAGEKRRLEQPAPHYAGDFSVSMLSGTGISLFTGAPHGSSGSVSVFAAGSQAIVSMGLGADVRIGLHGFLIDLGFGLSYGGGGSGGGGVALLPSLGLGYAVATASNVAFSPLLRANLAIVSSSPVFITAGAELPFTVFLGRNGFMEPFLFVGFATSAMGGAPMFSGSVGYRLGVTF